MTARESYRQQTKSTISNTIPTLAKAKKNAICQSLQPSAHEQLQMTKYSRLVMLLTALCTNVREIIARSQQVPPIISSFAYLNHFINKGILRPQPFAMLLPKTRYN